MASVSHVSGASGSSGSCPGLVSKVNLCGFTDGEKYAVYRKNDGIPESFQKNVLNAMKKPNLLYNLLTYNCIHFAMELLGVKVILL